MMTTTNLMQYIKIHSAKEVLWEVIIIEAEDILIKMIKKIY